MTERNGSGQPIVSASQIAEVGGWLGGSTAWRTNSHKLASGNQANWGEHFKPIFAVILFSLSKTFSKLRIQTLIISVYALFPHSAIIYIN
jgi:hypothetical protein